MLLVVFACIIAFWFLYPRPCPACTTVLVGKRASATGEVLVGHNEDSGGRYVMRTHLVSELNRERKPGPKTVRFEPECVALDLPPRRAKLYWSEARSYYTGGGASFCDFYINGNGVVVCSDNCGASREDRPGLTGGGVGYGLRRLVAERARSARDAVEIAADLLDRYGYIGNGRSYHFADKDEIWVLQAANGKRYAVARVPDDEVYLNPNHFTIRRPDASAPGVNELISYATERGWYDPQLDGAFDFARAYQAPEAYRAMANIHRHLRGLEMILDRRLDPEADLPFSVKPPRPLGVEDVKRVLRSHFEGTPDDVYTGSGGDTPHVMPTRPICTRTTLESTVVQVRNPHERTVIRRALGRPCLAPYIPWHFGVTRLPDAFEAFGGGDPDEALRTHFCVDARDMDYRVDDPWWIHAGLQTAVDMLYREKATAVREEIRILERELDGDFARLERSANGVEAMNRSARELTAKALDKMRALHASLGLATLELPKEIDADDRDAVFTVRVLIPDFDTGNVDMEKTLFGPSHAPFAKWSRPAAAEAQGEALALTFSVGDWGEASPPCLATDMWLAAEDGNGTRAAAMGVTIIRRRG